MGKVLTSLNDALLRRVYRISTALGLSGGSYLAGLAERDAARPDDPGASRTARRALERLDVLFAAPPTEDSTVAIRAGRDGR